jgi:hypothetical protein
MATLGCLLAACLIDTEARATEQDIQVSPPDQIVIINLVAQAKHDPAMRRQCGEGKHPSSDEMALTDECITNIVIDIWKKRNGY